MSSWQLLGGSSEPPLPEGQLGAPGEELPAGAQLAAPRGQLRAAPPQRGSWELRARSSQLVSSWQLLGGSSEQLLP